MSETRGRSRTMVMQEQEQRQVKDQKEEVVVMVKKQGRELRGKRKEAAVAKGRSLRGWEKRREDDDGDNSATATMPVPSISYSDSETLNSTLDLNSLSNLDRFLKYTTPVVPAHYFSKTSIRGRRDKNEEFRSYFVLGDLWESFREWSVYGAGVPLLLNGSDSVVQYYVPFLSAIQLYIDPSKPSWNIRRPGEESDGDSCRETSSDGSSDPDTGRDSNYFHGVLKLNQQDLTDATVQGIRELSVRSEPLNGSSSDEGEPRSSPGTLVFQYLEYAPPYSREPFSDKMSALASGFLDLKARRSWDLSPASWVSVAWDAE